MIFLVLRFWIKISRSCGLWWDDSLLALSWVTLVVNNAIISVLLSLGFGTEQSYTTHMAILLAISGVTIPLARVWSKTSFALTLLRVIDTKARFQRLFIWFVIISMHSLSILYCVMVWRRICESQATEDSQAVGRIPGPCLPLNILLALQISNIALSAFMDFALALFPWLIIWKLQMRLQEKIGTAVAMSLGILSGSRAGIFAILQIKGILTLAGPGYSEYRLATLSIVSSAEPTITIVAASIPVLRILLRDLYHKPTLVEVSTKGTSRAELRRTSTKIDRNTSVDQPRGITQKTEVEIEYSRKSSYAAHDSRGVGYEMDEWDLGLPIQAGTAR
ncbi:hypothetical protein PG993_008793 [Apiospora rasikravindrae]|uniref:Rhodopsin domain-containing protein n=1 Tax=Apiospora rasikravindrae TaxID=990691 RepID=A0ABR1SPC4_9PEZI